MKPRRITALAAGAGALALVLAACAGGGGETPEASTEPARGGTLRIGVADNIQSWDTTAASGGQLLQTYQAPYDTLIRKTPDGDLVPMLATSWEYDESLTELTLELESGVTFSDGEAFDAEAVRANLEYFSAGQGPQTSQLAALDSVEVVDEDTVTVHLAEPDPALLSYLASAAGLMASPAAIEAGTLATEPIGTGPYVLDTAASVVGSQYVLTAREDYWSPDLQRFSSVEFIYLEDTALVNALVSGQVDSTYVEFDAVPQVEAAGNTVLKNTADWEGLIIMDRDGQLVPALADARVRQAISQAIDRDAMNQGAAGGLAELTDQIFGPDTGAYVDSLDGTYPYDPERARELLAEAGYADGFEMTVPVPGPLSQPWALISQYLSEIGITVNQANVPFENFRGDIAAQKYPVALFRYNLGDPWGTSIRNLISTRAGVWNPFKTQTAELDELLDAVQNGGDQYQERAQAVNEYVVDEAWFVPLYRPVQNYAFNPATIDVVVQSGSAIPALYNFSPAAD